MPQYNTYGKPAGNMGKSQFGTGAGLTGGGEFAEYNLNQYAGDKAGQSGYQGQAVHAGPTQGTGAYSAATNQRLGSHRVVK